MKNNCDDALHLRCEAARQRSDAALRTLDDVVSNQLDMIDNMKARLEACRKEAVSVKEEKRAAFSARPGSHCSAVSQLDIMVRANQIWTAAGMPGGNTSRFWLQAEQELQQEGTEKH
jgi:hypothetical protein